jgi:sugar-specific transcriptional regulator TrmB
MPEILFAKGIASKLEQIIDEARSVIIMISPYVQFDNRIEEKLKFADERGISIVLLHKPRELKDDALKFFPNKKLTYKMLLKRSRFGTSRFNESIFVF